MGAHFHVELGPFTIDVQIDDSGVRLLRGPLSQTISWQQITGATLITSTQFDGLHEKQEERRAAQYLGPDALKTIQALRGKVAQIAIAYRDDNNHLRQTEIPAPLTDATFIREFQTRLGSRWLGESTDHEQANKRLHTNPGFFRIIFVLLTLLGILAVVAIVFLLGFMGPVLSFLSIQEMLLDLQDGNYASFTSRLITYVALLVIAYFIHRMIRVKLDSLKSARVARPITKL